MMTTKAPKTKEVTVNGEKYTLQSVPPSWYYDLVTRAQSSGGRIDIKLLNAELVENVVVSPKISLDDFGTPGEANKILKEIRSFLGVDRE
jgi:hypothetical protein